MAFKKLKITKELEIVSLLDIVLLLLIFGLIPLTKVINPGGMGTEPELTKTLLIEIYREKPEDPYCVVKIRYPNRSELFVKKFPDDSKLLKLKGNELKNNQAFSLISEKIKDYTEKYLEKTIPSKSGSIDLKIVNNAKFRIIGFIIEECSKYGDAINWLHVSTFKEKV